jgi:phosphoglycolate phosphatase
MELRVPQGLLFDLDGTLVDSVADIAAAANAVRVTRGIAALPPARIRGLIGDGARKLMERVVADLDVDPAEALAEFREHYAKCCVDQTRPYPGVAESLPRLDRWRRGVVSNKPQRFTEMVVEGTGLGGQFGAVIGARSTLPVKPDPALLRLAAEELEVDLADCWMIGDSPNDMRAARAAGCVAIGVSYGLCERERIEAEAPDHMLERFSDLLALLPAGA